MATVKDDFNSYGFRVSWKYSDKTLGLYSPEAGEASLPNHYIRYESYGVYHFIDKTTYEIIRFKLVEQGQSNYKIIMDAFEGFLFDIVVSGDTDLKDFLRSKIWMF